MNIDIPLVLGEATVTGKLVIGAVTALVTALIGFVIWVSKRWISKISQKDRLDYAKNLSELVQNLEEKGEAPDILRAYRDHVINEVATKTHGRFDPVEEERAMRQMEEAIGGASKAGALSDGDLKNIGMLVSGLQNETLDARFQGLMYSGILTKIEETAVGTDQFKREKEWWRLWHVVAKIQFLSTYRLMERMEVQIKRPMTMIVRQIAKTLVVDELAKEYLSLAHECEIPAFLQDQIMKEIEYLRSLARRQSHGESDVTVGSKGVV